MIKKKEKGAALLVVIMVMAVLLILGTSILNISWSETNQAAYEDKRMQAHYLARSGAEATLKAWEDSSAADKPSGTSRTIYLNSSNQFVDTSPSNMIGKFNITVTPPSEGNTDTVITSVGTVGSVTQTVAVTIKATTSQINVPPLSTSDVVLGHSVGWYDFASGQINTGTHADNSGKTVKFEAKGGKGIKLPSKNSPAVTYEANKILFTSPVQTMHNTITLISNVIALNEGVDFSNKNEKEKLVLKFPSPGVITISGINYGVVYFKNVGYYFPNGVELKTESDIASKLIPIPSSDTTNYNNPFLSGSTQTISTYSVLWD